MKRFREFAVKIYQSYPNLVNISFAIIITFIVYFNSLKSYYIAFDDFNWPPFYNVSISEIFFSKSTGAVLEGNYRPIEVLSHKIDNFFFGSENTFVRHLLNLFIHTINIIIIYLLSFSLTQRRVISLISSLIFSLHFIHSYSLTPVSWITGRVDPLLTVFYLTSLLLFIKFLTSKVKLLYFISILSFLIALLTKEMAVTLPLIILLFNIQFYLPKSELSNFNLSKFYNNVKYSIPYFIVLMFYLIVRLKILGGMGGNYNNASFNLSIDSFVRDIYSLIGLVFPVGKEYNNYIFNLQIHSEFIFYAVGMMILFFMIFILYKLIKRRSSILLFLFMWTIITALPVHNILLPLHQFQQRYLYLPIAGFSIFVAIILIENKEFFFARLSKSLSVGILILFFCISSFLIITHHNKIAESGAIIYGFQKDMQKYNSLDLDTSNLYFITFPIDPLSSISSVFIASGYMDVLLQFNFQNYHKNFDCNILFHTDEKENSWNINWLSDKSFIIDDINPSKWYVIPSTMSELDKKREAIYGRIPHPLMVSLSSAAETVNCRVHDSDSSAAVVKVIHKNNQYKRAKLEVELINAPKLKARKSLFFVFKEGHFRHIKTINIQ